MGQRHRLLLPILIWLSLTAVLTGCVASIRSSVLFHHPTIMLALICLVSLIAALSPVTARLASPMADFLQRFSRSQIAVCVSLGALLALGILLQSRAISLFDLYPCKA